ncbi:hypothetical protein BHM03_00050109 [Ensete ventricosum]|nr:hypothetical protein BHM03_00050109 [Ensete ventricosum]
MVGLAYDFLANPLGAVRLAFEKAVASSPPDADPAAAFRGNDWGAVDLFRDFLFEQGGLSQVTLWKGASGNLILVLLRLFCPMPLNSDRKRSQNPKFSANSLTLNHQVPILDASTRRWVQPNTLVRFRGMVQDMLGNELYVGAYKVPGQNSWAMEPSPSPGVRNMSSSTSQHGVKRGRNTEDDMDLNVILYVFVPYPP